MIRAIDVSRWQGTIDWHAVARDGVQGAWIKVGGADAGRYRDGRSATYLRDVEGVLPYGTYYFCEPAIGDAETQARHAVEVGHGKGQLWPMLDLETNPHRLSNRQLDEFASQFCDEVMRLTGRDSILYCGAGTGVGWTPSAPSCPLWIANYGANRPSASPPGFDPKIPAAWADEGWSIWQFNSTTRVAGIPGNTVDQNVVRPEFWEQMLQGGRHHVAKEWSDMATREEFQQDLDAAYDRITSKVLENIGNIERNLAALIRGESGATRDAVKASVEAVAGSGVLPEGTDTDALADALLAELADRLTSKT